MIYTALYEWPHSQICMDCGHRRPEILSNSGAICSCAETRNDGVRCPSFYGASIKPRVETLLDEEECSDAESR